MAHYSGERKWLIQKNDYGWSLDSDYICHSPNLKKGAHYSKNWTAADQKEYNHWYYINKIKKKVTDAVSGSEEDIKTMRESSSKANVRKDIMDGSLQNIRNRGAYSGEYKEHPDYLQYDLNTYKQARKEKKEAEATYNKAKDHYESTSIAGMHDKAVREGKKAISNLLSSISSIVSKATSKKTDK